MYLKNLFAKYTCNAIFCVYLQNLRTGAIIKMQWNLITRGVNVNFRLSL